MSVVVKGRIQAAGGQIQPVHAGVQRHRMATGPLPVAEHPADPVHVLRRLNRMRKAKQIGLRLQLPGAGFPQVRQLADQLRVDPQLSALLQQPCDIGGHHTGKTALFLRRCQPAGEKQVLLRRRQDAAVTTGQRQRHQSAPGHVPGE
ncbi:hypothetical protein D3C81_1594450 [compost metagenome]